MGDAFLRWADRRLLIGHSKGYDMRRLVAVFRSDILPGRRWDSGAVVVRLQEHRAVVVGHRRRTECGRGGRRCREVAQHPPQPGASLTTRPADTAAVSGAGRWSPAGAWP